jgi:hypothetical protein
MCIASWSLVQEREGERERERERERHPKVKMGILEF